MPSWLRQKLEGKASEPAPRHKEGGHGRYAQVSQKKRPRAPQRDSETDTHREPARETQAEEIHTVGVERKRQGVRIVWSDESDESEEDIEPPEAQADTARPTQRVPAQRDRVRGHPEGQKRRRVQGPAHQVPPPPPLLIHRMSGDRSPSFAWTHTHVWTTGLWVRLIRRLRAA